MFPIILMPSSSWVKKAATRSMRRSKKFAGIGSMFCRPARNRCTRAHDAFGKWRAATSDTMGCVWLSGTRQPSRLSICSYYIRTPGSGTIHTTPPGALVRGCGLSRRRNIETMVQNRAERAY
uniref:Uncharacterized protein n=1 Tax=Anopheles minimus TaxID=112268 RepID=A0A182WNK8_9DIPT